MRDASASDSDFQPKMSDSDIERIPKGCQNHVKRCHAQMDGHTKKLMRLDATSKIQGAKMDGHATGLKDLKSGFRWLALSVGASCVINLVANIYTVSQVSSNSNQNTNINMPTTNTNTNTVGSIEGGCDAHLDETLCAGDPADNSGLRHR